MDQFSNNVNPVMYNRFVVKSKIAQLELDDFATDLCKTCSDQPGEAFSFTDFTLCGSDGRCSTCYNPVLIPPGTQPNEAKKMIEEYLETGKTPEIPFD